MAKGYWVSFYQRVLDPEKQAAYAALAGPAIAAAGGKILARGTAAAVYEGGLKERVVIVEFESVAAAIACHEGPAYKEALRVFDGASIRDMRITEGLD